MSTPIQRRDFVFKVVHETKEATVARSPQDDPGDMCPVVFFERDGSFVAAATAPDVDRDLGLEIARVGIRGFAADAVFWCADAHVTNQRLNPATGQPWGPLEMQNACNDEGACVVGLLQDVIVVIRADRDLGVTGYQSIPYEVDKEARTVDWIEGPDWANPSWTHDSPAEGYIADELMAAFQAPILRHDMIARNALPLGLPDVQQALLDEITVGGLSMVGMKATLIKRDLAEELLASYAPV